MAAMGFPGLLAGFLTQRGIVAKGRLSLSVFGALTALIVYGGIVNSSAVLLAQANPTVNMLLAAYAAGLPLDILHALSTAFFLFTFSAPMLSKLQRVKTKYGLIGGG